MSAGAGGCSLCPSRNSPEGLTFFQVERAEMKTSPGKSPSLSLQTFTLLTHNQCSGGQETAFLSHQANASQSWYVHVDTQRKYEIKGQVRGK